MDENERKEELNFVIGKLDKAIKVIRTHPDYKELFQSHEDVSLYEIWLDCRAQLRNADIYDGAGTYGDEDQERKEYQDYRTKWMEEDIHDPDADPKNAA